MSTQWISLLFKGQIPFYPHGYHVMLYQTAGSSRGCALLGWAGRVHRSGTQLLQPQAGDSTRLYKSYHQVRTPDTITQPPTNRGIRTF